LLAGIPTFPEKVAWKSVPCRYVAYAMVVDYENFKGGYEDEFLA